MNSTVVELIEDVELGGFTARMPDIPAYGEGETEQEALDDLKKALRGYVETFGMEDALAHLTSPAVRYVDWNLAELTHG